VAAQETSNGTGTNKNRVVPRRPRELGQDRGGSLRRRDAELASLAARRDPQCFFSVWSTRQGGKKKKKRRAPDEASQGALSPPSKPCPEGDAKFFPSTHAMPDLQHAPGFPEVLRGRVKG